MEKKGSLKASSKKDEQVAQPSTDNASWKLVWSMAAAIKQASEEDAALKKGSKKKKKSKEALPVLVLKHKDKQKTFTTKITSGNWQYAIWSESSRLGHSKVKLEAPIVVTDKLGNTIANSEILLEKADKLTVSFTVSPEQAPASVVMKFSTNAVLKGVDISATLSRESSVQDIADELNIFPEDLEVLLQTFKKYGTGDGLLAYKEFEDAIADVQIDTGKAIFSPTYAKVTWELFDADHSGKIDAAEFLAAVTILASGTLEEKATLSFKAFDKDGDGYLSKKELLHQLKIAAKVSDKISSAGSRDGLGAAGQMFTEGKQLFHSGGSGKEEINRIFAICDTDNDGQISLAEWIVGAQQSEVIQMFFDPVARFRPITAKRSIGASSAVRN